MTPELEQDFKDLLYRWRMPRTHSGQRDYARGQEQCAQELTRLLIRHGIDLTAKTAAAISESERPVHREVPLKNLGDAASVFDDKTQFTPSDGGGNE